MATFLATLAAAVTPKPDTMNFYVVAATIIPVLFLALIYQANVIEEWEDKPGLMAAWAFIYVLNSVLGEVAALRVLAAGHPVAGMKGTVFYALIVVGGGLAGSPLVAVIGPVLKAHPDKVPLVLTLFAVGTVVIGLAAVNTAGGV
jgi:hypothetical protein